MLRHRIIWDTNDFTMHRGGVDPRPAEIQADQSEVIYDGNSFPIGIRFIKNDVAVATFFALPIGVVVDDVPQ